MNKILFAASAMLTSLALSQTAFAESPKSLTKDDITATAEGYLLEHSERPKPRRSALVAHVLDNMTKNSTLAKETESTTGPLQVSQRATPEITLF